MTRIWEEFNTVKKHEYRVKKAQNGFYDILDIDNPELKTICAIICQCERKSDAELIKTLLTKNQRVTKSPKKAKHTGKQLQD